MSAGALLGWMAVVAAVAAVIKVLTSGRGKVSVPGITIQWGN